MEPPRELEACDVLSIFLAQHIPLVLSRQKLSMDSSGAAHSSSAGTWLLALGLGS